MAPRASSPGRNTCGADTKFASPPCRQPLNALCVALELDDYRMVLRVLDADATAAQTLCDSRSGAEMPLSYAVSCHCSLDIFELLVKRGAMVDAVGSSGLTPLAAVAGADGKKPTGVSGSFPPHQKVALTPTPPWLCGYAPAGFYETGAAPIPSVPWRGESALTPRPPWLCGYASVGFSEQGIAQTLSPPWCCVSEAEIARETGFPPPKHVIDFAPRGVAKPASCNQDWHLKVGALLLRHGADPAWKDKQNHTTLERAVASGHVELAQRLEAWIERDALSFLKMIRCQSPRRTSGPPSGIRALRADLVERVADFVQPGCLRARRNRLHTAKVA